MKKFFYFGAILLFGVTCMTSCLDSDGDSAEATVDFGAEIDSIFLDDPNDSVFISAIDTAMQEMGVVSTVYSGIPSVLFKETAKVNVSSIPYAVLQAVEQAKVTYNTRIVGATRDQLIRYIKAAKTPTSMPADSLDGFSVKTTLVYAYGSTGLSTAKSYTKQF